MSKGIWLADSGASSHLCNDDTGMFNVKMIHALIKVGSGKNLIATKMGDIKAIMHTQDGEEETLILRNVKFVPELWINLISIPVALKGGWRLGNEGLRINLTTPFGRQIRFNRIFNCGRAYVCGIKLTPITNLAAHEIAQTNTEESATNDRTHNENNTIVKNINDVHSQLGHVGEDAVRKTAAYYGWTLTGKLKPCEQCGVSKAKQAAVSKELNEKSKTPGERLFIDISSMNATSYGESKYWLMALDDCTDKVFSYFIRRKSDAVEAILTLCRNIEKQIGHAPKYIRCDDSGENRAAQRALLHAGIHTQFEFTPPNTPQRNGRVERKFKTLYDRMRTSFNAAGMDDELKRGLWAEAAQMATFNDNLMISSTRPISSFQAFDGKNPAHANSLKTFGEVAVVTDMKDRTLRSKLKLRGKICILIGYPEDTSNDCYRMWNLSTKALIKTRDILWLNKSYGEYMGDRARDSLSSNYVINVLDSGTDDDVELLSPPSISERQMTEEQTEETLTGALYTPPSGTEAISDETAEIQDRGTTATPESPANSGQTELHQRASPTQHSHHVSSEDEQNNGGANEPKTDTNEQDDHQQKAMGTYTVL